MGRDCTRIVPRLERSCWHISEEEEVKRIIQTAGLPRFTDNTITDEKELLQNLAKIRKQGYAYDLEEILPDLCCVAAPIYNHTGQVIAAISMSIPAYRFKRSQTEFRDGVIRAAKKISKRLGYYGSSKKVSKR